MGKLYRSARGEMVDFDLLAIKQQLASMPVPSAVDERKRAVAIKNGAKPEASQDTAAFFAAGMEAAAVSQQAATTASPSNDVKPDRGSQINNK